MKHNIYFDDSKNLAKIIFLGDFLEKDVPEIKEKLENIFADKKLKQLIVVMSLKHKVENRIARQEAMEVISEIKIKEVAFVGGSAANRIIAKILLKTMQKNLKGDIFKTEEEAFNWLKSKR